MNVSMPAAIYIYIVRTSLHMYQVLFVICVIRVLIFSSLSLSIYLSISFTCRHWDRYEVLHDRIMENDIRVVAKYYSRIKTARLAEFLKLSTDKTEEYVADMVTSGTIPLAAKIDRPAGVVVFEPKKDANAVLTEWTEDISELLGLVEKTCHLIHKENMMHTAKAKAA
jgi:hypothetical protein